MSDQPRKRSLTQALNTGVRKYGTAIVSNLAIAVKTTQLYSFEHQNVSEALKELNEFLDSFIQLEGEAEISRVDDFLFINEVRIKVDLGGLQTFEFVLGLLKEREIGRLVFADSVTREQLKTLVDLLTRPVADPENPWKWFQQQLAGVSLPDIRVEKYEELHEEREEISDDRRMLAIALVFRAVQYMRETIDAVSSQRKINFKRLKRVIQAMVDTVLDDEPTILALVNIKDHGSRAANHAVNVAILSIALGARLGFSKKLLGDLGIAALMHDIGKLRIPQELRDRDLTGLTGEDREAAEGHVYTGVEVLLDQRIVDAVVKSMNVAFLHHFRFDSTGFPRTHVVKAQNYYSRIVAMANHYDNRTWSRPGGPPAAGPDEVLRGLLDESGTAWDPLLVKAFVNLLGLYPIGSMVHLDSGEVGTVVAPASNPRFLDRPTVRLFADASGAPADEEVDLMEKVGGRFRRSILKLYQQEEVALEMEEYLSVI